MDTIFENEFDFAKKIITESGEISLSYFEKNPKSRLKADETIVTEADERIEETIRKRAQAAFPSYGFIGEETDEEIKDTCWIVDPIDGTTAFSRGIPNFASVIALEAEGEIMFSFIYFPVSQTLYSASLGKGAQRNENPIRVSLVDNMDQALISFDRKAAQREYSAPYVERFIKEYRVRMGDHAGLASSYLAQGSIDVLAKFQQKIWDTAPESLLLSEAGAVVTDEFGNLLQLSFSKQSHTHYIATNQSLNQKYNDLLYFSK